jgi:hypothetical protein
MRNDRLRRESTPYSMQIACDRKQNRDPAATPVVCPKKKIPLCYPPLPRSLHAKSWFAHVIDPQAYIIVCQRISSVKSTTSERYTRCPVCALSHPHI